MGRRGRGGEMRMGVNVGSAEVWSGFSVLNEPLHTYCRHLTCLLVGIYVHTVEDSTGEGYRGQWGGEKRESLPGAAVLRGREGGERGGLGSEQRWVGAGAGTRAASRDLASRRHGAWWDESAES